MGIVNKRVKYRITDRFLIVTLTFIAVFPRLLFLPVPFIVNVADAAGYVELADIFLRGVKNLNLSQFFDTYLYRTPTYPIFLAVIKFFFGKHYLLGFSLVQHILGILTVVIVYLLSKRVFGGSKLISFASAFLVAVNPHQLYWEHNAMTEFLSNFLLVLSTFYLVKAWQEEKFSLFTLSGALFGLTILCRPVFQAVWVFVPLVILLQFRNFRKTLRASLYFLLPLLLIVSTWLFKNYFRHNFFGLSTLMGPSAMNRTERFVDFDSGVHLPEKAIYKEVFDYYQPDENNRIVFPAWFQIQKKMGYGEVEVNRVFLDIFLETIKNNPHRYIRETIPEIKRMLFTDAILNLALDVDLSSEFRELYKSKLYYGDAAVNLHADLLRVLSVPFDMSIIAVLATFGFVASLVRKNWGGVLFAWFILYLVLTTTLLGPGLSRYRLPIEPFLFMLAVYGLLVPVRGFLRIFRGIYGGNFS